jgi:hypothetical protein
MDHRSGKARTFVKKGTILEVDKDVMMANQALYAPAPKDIKEPPRYSKDELIHMAVEKKLARPEEAETLSIKQLRDLVGAD